MNPFKVRFELNDRIYKILPSSGFYFAGLNKEAEFKNLETFIELIAFMRDAFYCNIEYIHITQDK